MYFKTEEDKWILRCNHTPIFLLLCLLAFEQYLLNIFIERIISFVFLHISFFLYIYIYIYIKKKKMKKYLYDIKYSYQILTAMISIICLYSYKISCIASILSYPV